MIAIPLVQRWAVERMFRPPVPGIEWLGYAKPLLRDLECFACGGSATQQGVLRATFADGRARVLFACPACGSHRYDGPPPAAAEPSPMAVRHHVEYAADLPAIARMLARVLGDADPGSVLIAGCGFGFGVSMARAAGWVAFGFDPEPFARAGHAAVGVTVSHRADPDPVGPGRFDAMCADGILGRSDDPYALAVELAGRLVDGGALLIEEPDVGTIYSAAEPAAVRAAAAPGRSMMLPTAAGLSSMLARAGFGDHAVVAEAGRLRVSRRDGPPGDPEALLATWLDEWTPVRIAGEQSVGLPAGVAVRALERAVNAGNWGRARELADALESVVSGVNTLSALQTSDGSLDGLFARIPFGAASAAYHAAMLALNGDGQPARARAGFMSAAALSRAAYAADSAAMLPEADRVWAARFHAAFVGHATGDPAAASALDDIVGGRPEAPLPPPSSAWIARAADLLRPASQPASRSRSRRKTARAP